MAHAAVRWPADSRAGGGSLAAHDVSDAESRAEAVVEATSVEYLNALPGKAEAATKRATVAQLLRDPRSFSVTVTGELERISPFREG